MREAYLKLGATSPTKAMLGAGIHMAMFLTNDIFPRWIFSASIRRGKGRLVILEH